MGRRFKHSRFVITATREPRHIRDAVWAHIEHFIAGLDGQNVARLSQQGPDPEGGKRILQNAAFANGAEPVVVVDLDQPRTG